MTRYFHFAPLLLAPGSIIEPGNFGRIIRQRGAAHPLYRREMFYENIRQNLFPTMPSRLNCLFCFPTLEEAELCRVHISGYKESILYEVENSESNPHYADMNNTVQHFSLPVFDKDIAACYWRGWRQSHDPKAVIFREVLLRSPIVIIRRI